VALETVPGRDTHYHLISYDKSGQERMDRGERYSTAVLHEFAGSTPTDVFVFSHGWQGDVPAARGQYGRWIAAMLDDPDGPARLDEQGSGSRPVLIGLHWPSKAWGDEELGPASFAVATGPADSDSDADSDFDADRDDKSGADDVVSAMVDRYADRLIDTPSVREAIATIVRHALEDVAPDHLPELVRSAYRVIDGEISRQVPGGAGAPPGEDREPFDPEATYQACQLEEIVSFGSCSLGGLLAPLRMLTFWQMKRRAKDFGESGAAALLDDLQEAAPHARFHLMGHSFGCIVTSAAVTGPPRRRTPRRPVASLVLAQGALSLWSFCSSIPARPDSPGYFHRLVAHRLVAGPVLATTSQHDRAVRAFYPIGAGVRRQVEFDTRLPTYGGVGVFGARGPGLHVADDDVPTGGKDYDLRPGKILNLDATAVIKNGAGPSGAHNDICHPEIAHAVWQAITASAGSHRG
jgi:hypothetical protein